MDLSSIIVRAQALFRRFQRTVEAVDKKNNFPAPSTVRQRRPGVPSPSTSPDTNKSPPLPSTSTGNDANTGPKWNYNANSSSRTEGAARKPSTNNPQNSAGPSKSTAQNPHSPGDTDQDGEAAKKKVISPELRALLSRKWSKLDKESVEKHGGGVGS